MVTEIYKFRGAKETAMGKAKILFMRQHGKEPTEINVIGRIESENSWQVQVSDVKIKKPIEEKKKSTSRSRTKR